MVNIQILYNMAEAASKQANDARQGERYKTYRTYVEEYNHLLALTLELCGAEVDEYLKPIDVRTMPIPDPDYMVELLSLAALRLTELVGYLEPKTL